MTELSIALAYAARPAATDAIAAYCSCLGRALTELPGVSGTTIDVALGDTRAWTKSARMFDATILQYNPFSFGRWGWAPWLVDAYRNLAVDRHTAVMFHETYVPLTSPAFRVMRTWQRRQVRELASASNTVFASSETWSAQVRALRFGSVVHHLPVGSMLPPASLGARDRERAELSAENRFVVVTFGTGHPSRSFEHLEQAIERIGAEADRLLVLNLGAGAPPLHVRQSHVEVHTPGALPSQRIADLLAAADLGLMPFVDGVSARRSSFAALIQQGVPVLTTIGENTDPPYSEASKALAMTDVNAVPAFAQRAVELFHDPIKRATLAKAGQRLYAAHLSWPALARRTIDALAIPRGH